MKSAVGAECCIVVAGEKKQTGVVLAGPFTDSTGKTWIVGEFPRLGPGRVLLIRVNEEQVDDMIGGVDGRKRKS